MRNRQFLGDPDQIQAMMDAVANQGSSVKNRLFFSSVDLLQSSLAVVQPIQRRGTVVRAKMSLISIFGRISWNCHRSSLFLSERVLYGFSIAATDEISCWASSLRRAVTAEVISPVRCTSTNESTTNGSLSLTSNGLPSKVREISSCTPSGSMSATSSAGRLIFVECGWISYAGCWGPRHTPCRYEQSRHWIRVCL